MTFGRTYVLGQRKNYCSFWLTKIRCHNKVVYCTKHVSLHTNQSSFLILSCESCHHISCCILRLSYMTRHEGSKLITLKLLQFFGGVFNALIVILIYHNIYVLTKNCYNIVYLEWYRFEFFIHVTSFIVTNFHVMKPTRCTNFSNFFGNETLHVSDSPSVHHQELFTVNSATVYVSFPK
jgi:hypothetical protein